MQIIPTPLIKLEHISSDTGCNVYGKLEMLSIGGSMKDRSSMNMIEKGIANGVIRPHTTVIESSSGNMGVGMARACRLHRLRFVCVVDQNITNANLRLMELYGAEILQAQPETGESLLSARLRTVKAFADQNQDVFWVNQYANPDNPTSYYSMMDEVVAELGDSIDYIVCATGTLGTLRGCSDYVRSHDLHTKLIAIDAEGSVIFGGLPKKRLIPGHGSSITPALFRENLYDYLWYATDADCIRGCQVMLEKEALLVGGSSGAIISSVMREKAQFKPNSTVVLILPDRGEKYLDTIFNETWVKENNL